MTKWLNDMELKNKVDEYALLANQGDILAQKQLGLLLSKDDTTLNEGVAWLKKAAETDAEAMYLLGRLYLKKLKDKKKAFFWYESAAQKEHINAMVDVAAFYLFGYEVDRNIDEAVKWYKKAAKLNSPLAYHNLGYLCFQDSELHDTAIDYFKKATELGYAESAYMLGIMFLYGYGTEKNPKEALDCFVSSFDLGKHHTCRALGDLYFQGAFNDGKQNIDKAIEWYLRGVDKQVLPCIEVLGDCYYFGFGIDIDYELAFDFYKTAAEKGSANAAFMLGSMYSNGQSVKKNYREALKWMLVAKNLKHPKAAHFVEMLTDLVNSNGPAAGISANGGSVGVKLRSSYSAGVEAVEAEQRARYEENKKRNAGIYAAVGAMSGHGSYTDYEMGAVIGLDGDVSYVDTDLGVILGADGSVSSHDSNTGFTYNYSTGDMMAYDETFNATLDFKSGDISYNYNGFTIK